MSSALTEEYFPPLWDVETKRVLVDNSIVSYRDTEYQTPQTLSATDSTYRLSFSDEAQYALLSDAKIHVRYTVSRTSTAIPLPHPAIEQDHLMIPDPWGLFSSVACSINNQLIGVITNPGTAHMIKKIADFSSDYATAVGSMEGFYPLTKLEPFSATTDIGYSPVEIITGITTTQALQQGVTAANGQKVWLPAHSMSSPLQKQYVLSGGSAPWTLTATGLIRSNPHYSPNFGRGNSRISVNTYPNVAGLTQPNYETMSVNDKSPAYASLEEMASLITSTKTVDVMLKLSDLFPVLEQVCKIAIRGSKLDIVLQKQSNWASAFYQNYVTSGMSAYVTISKVSLWIPLLRPSITAKLHVERIKDAEPTTFHKYTVMEKIETTEIPISMLSNRIKINVDTGKIVRVLVAFRSSLTQTRYDRNPYCFVGLNASQLQMKVNGMNIPESPYSTNDNNCARVLYEMYGEKNYDDSEGSLINHENFRDGPMRIYSFDCNMQDNEFDTTRISDVEFNYQLSAQPATPYDVILLVLSEKGLYIKERSGKSKVDLV